jgi:hypothetical protein
VPEKVNVIRAMSQCNRDEESSDEIRYSADDESNLKFLFDCNEQTTSEIDLEKGIC